MVRKVAPLVRLFGLVGVLVLAATLRADAQQPAKPQTPPKPARGENPPVTSLAIALDSRLRTAHPDTFAGIIRLPGEALEVRATANRPAFATDVTRTVDDFRRGQSPGTPVASVRITADSKNSLLELERIQDQLTARAKEFKGRGIDFREWGVDIRANRVRIGVNGLTPAIQAVLEQEFGVDKIYVLSSVGEIGRSRSDDTVPWWGGISMTSASGNTCTAGYAFWLENGTGSMHSTAGHCGLDVWYQNNELVGRTADLEFQDFGTVDAQLIRPAGVHGRVWISEFTSRAVHTFSTIQGFVGDPVCSDGFFTGERCGSIVLVNQCVTLPTSTGFVTICGVNRANNGHSPAIVGGDSGGPVYAVNPQSGVHALGMIVSVNAAMPEIYSYTPIWRIRARFNAIPLGE